MNQLLAPTKQNRIQMFREARANARARGDLNMVHAMNVELATLGVFEENRATLSYETTQEPGLEEKAVPEKPRRGRKPLPRCEHEMIAARCPECSEDVI